MIRKIMLGLLVVVAICATTGCGKKEEHQNDTKNYDAIIDSYYDCNFKTIDDIIYESNLIVSNSKVYELSSKKNTETDNHCRPIYKNENNYTYIGFVRTYSDGECALFLNNEGNIIAVDKNGQEVNYRYEEYIDIEELYREKNFKYFRYTNTTLFQTPYYYYFTDNYLYYQIDDLGNEISLPNDEKVLYFGIHDPDWTKSQSKNIFMLITNKNKYIVDIASDDKCREYEDVKCSYILNLTKMYDEVLRDFNIKYFDGKRLITNDNIMYHIRQYYSY